VGKSRVPAYTVSPTKANEIRAYKAILDFLDKHLGRHSGGGGQLSFEMRGKRSKDHQ